MGGLEILVICAIIGGLLGLASKEKKTARWIGFLLGMVGAAIIAFLLAQFVFQSLLAIPVYAIIGSWLANFLFKKISN